jgi:hypothetical protein
MRTSSIIVLSLVLSGALLSSASRTSAQEATAPRAQGAGQAGRAAGADSAAKPVAIDTTLTFEREVFSYPRFGRRNPFRPLSGTDGGPRFEDLELRGTLVVGSNPRQSVAILALRGLAQRRVITQANAAGRAQAAGTALVADTILVPSTTMRLHVGETWGRVRIVQILKDRVVVDVTEFGVTERKTLPMTAVVRPGGGL